MLEFSDEEIETALRQFAVGELGELRAIFNSPWWWPGSDLITGVGAKANALHDAGEIDLATMYSALSPETNHKERGQLESLFWAIVPAFHAHPDTLVTLLNLLVAQQMLPSDREWNGEALLRWCRGQADHPSQMMSIAEDDTARPFNGLLSAIVAGCEIDAQVYARRAMRFLNDPRSNVRIATIQALGLVTTDDDRLKADILAALHTVQAGSLDPDRENALRAALRLFAKNAGLDASLDRTLDLAAVGLEPPLVRQVVGNTLAFHALEISVSARNKLLAILVGAEAEEADVLHTTDHLLYRLISSDHWEQGLDFLADLLKAHPDISIRDFSGFSGTVSNKPGRMEHLVFNWLKTGNVRLSKAVSELLSRYGEDDFRASAGNVAETFSSEKRLLVARRTLGRCLHLPLSAASILLACMTNADKSVRVQIGNWLINPLLLNYPGALRAYLGSELETQPATVADDLKSILSVHDEHMKEIADIGRLKELEPSSSQRFMAHEKRLEDMAESSEIAESNSPLLNLVSRKIILYGNKTVVHMERNRDEAPVRAVVPMHSYEISTELPKVSIFDPVGLNYRIFKFVLEDDGE